MWFVRLIEVMASVPEWPTCGGEAVSRGRGDAEEEDDDEDNEDKDEAEREREREQLLHM